MFEYMRNPSPSDIRKMLESGDAIIYFNIEKEEIESLDFRRVDKLINSLKEVGKPARESVIIMVDGYNDIPDELYEIPEVVKFVNKLFEKHPYLFYYINKRAELEGDIWLLNCLADEIYSVTDSRYKGMSIEEIVEKFGIEGAPNISSKVVYKNGKLDKILLAMIKHGKKNKDSIATREMVLRYALKFDAQDIIDKFGFGRD